MEYTRQNIVELGIDLARGEVQGNFSNRQATQSLRDALIQANGGSDKIDYKSLRRNKTEIFEIIEEIIPVISVEGLRNDAFFMNLVEERNLAEGDMNEFVVEDNSEFIVSKIANGIASARRQRIGEKTSVTIKTDWYAVTIYDELSLFLAGRRDWNSFVNKVAKAFQKKILESVYATFSGINASTVGLNETYVKSGTYSEETLLAIVEHVEAATGKSATIVGTKAALRKVTSAVVADSAKEDYYSVGYYGRVAGVPMVAIKNAHRENTDTFIYPDNELYILASDDKPIKLIREGEGYIFDEDGSGNADKSIGYTYMEKFGVGLIINGKLGKYTVA